MQYSPDYDGTQHYSPRFLEYIDALINHLVHDIGIRRQTVLEIGCGQGEFLERLCQQGNCRGIGIDPSCSPRQLEGQMMPTVSYLRDCYGPQHAKLDADFICCRHTLEHIPATREFLRMIRTSLGSRLNTLLFFEVPDTYRILTEHAFWDMYYEHCSYFTMASLARLFIESGFAIEEIRRDFDDQYLCILARPSRNLTSNTTTWNQDVDELGQRVDTFQQVHQDRIEHWQIQLKQMSATGKRVVLWGASSKSVAFLTALEDSADIDCVVDINPHKYGKYLPGTGLEIVSPDALAEHRPDTIILMNSIYRDEVKLELQEQNIASELVAL
ncbi:MAG: class I SAM-dependent methyltransferase [Pirellulaceae bacterium]